jgi:hypothetical protein
MWLSAVLCVTQEDLAQKTLLINEMFCLKMTQVLWIPKIFVPSPLSQ